MNWRCVMVMLLALAALGSPMPGAAQRANTTAADAENRWVAFPLRDRPGYSYGFVYIDTQAGFTVDTGGEFTIDPEGNYVKVPGSSPVGYRASVRLTTNPRVMILPVQAIGQLGLQATPDWLSVYRDTSDPIARGIGRGRAFNHIGASQRALVPLEEVLGTEPNAPGLAFELAYAYNVLGRFDRAAEVATAALQREPGNWVLCKEAAYAHRGAGRYGDAVEQYKRCLAITPESDPERRAELAYNLAGTYRALAEHDQCRQWLANAIDWAPPGSELQRAAKQTQGEAGSCGR